MMLGKFILNRMNSKCYVPVKVFEDNQDSSIIKDVNTLA